jgi:hypothetical protein
MVETPPLWKAKSRTIHTKPLLPRNVTLEKKDREVVQGGQEVGKRNRHGQLLTFDLSTTSTLQPAVLC